ncbi:MAG: Fic family protein [Parachlamydia sp.]|nr:Fic family protein [Parachlamydia sp.]
MDLTLEVLGFKASDLPDYNEKGSPGFYKGIKLEMNPQRMRNFQKALNCAEKNIVQNARFFEKSDDEILDIVKAIHKNTMKDILPQDRAGLFRTDVLIVASDRDSADISTIVKSSYRKIMRIGTADEIALFKSSLLKLQEDFFDGIRNLASEERRVWDKLIIISPMPEKVEQEMRQFVQQLKRHHKEGMTATQLACFAHNEIGRIHAFEDGNGRLSFILLNAFLKRAGVPEVVFPNDNDYTRIIMEERQNPGALCRYLEEQMIPWTNAHRNVLELADAV